jgi:hypothetical protein
MIWQIFAVVMFVAIAVVAVVLGLKQAKLAADYEDLLNDSRDDPHAANR